jgi:hypothetical protein
MTAWDDRRKSANIPGQILTPRGFLPLGPDRVLVCEYGNNRLHILPKTNYVQINYDVDIPYGYRPIDEEYRNLGTGATSFTETVPIYRLHEVGPKIIPLEYDQ